MAEYKDIKISGGDTSAPLNLAKRLKLMKPYIKSGADTLLDCGCGGGEYVYALRSEFSIESYGIEYSAAKVKSSMPELVINNRVFCGNIEMLPFTDESFDVVLINEVLEHVPNETTSLKEIYRVLKRGGTLIVFSPNRLYPFESHGIQIKHSSKVLPIYTPFVPYIPLWLGNKFFNYLARNYWPNELETKISQHGFNVIEHDYVWQTFENISGDQPRFIQKLNSIFRRISNVLEKTSLIRRFALSQMVVAKKT